MPNTYTYFEVENFPEHEVGYKLQTITQQALGLPGDDDTIHTEIEYLGNSENPNFLKLHVKHEKIRKIKARFENVYRDHVIEVVEFNLFKSRQGRSMLASIGASDSHSMFKRLTAKLLPDFEWYERIVNLRDVKADLFKNIRGGWFRELRIANTRSAGIFGPTVAEGEDWNRYETNGNMSALLVEIAVGEGEEGESVMVTQQGTVVLYTPYSENDALALVGEIDDLLAPFSTLHQGGGTTRARQQE